MNKRKKMQLISLSASIMVLSSIIASRFDKSLRDENEINEATIIEEVNNQYNKDERYEFHMVSDVVDINESINSLGITQSFSLPSKMYKVLRYVDSNHYERISVVFAYIDYITDENKNVIGKTYTIKDAFTSEIIMKTNNLKFDELSNDYDVIDVISYGNLNDLKEIALSKGMDSEYVNNVMYYDIKEKTISIYEVARMYVMLINSNYRINNYNLVLN